MKQEIKLGNRYRAVNKLVLIDEEKGKYKFVCSNPQDYEWLRIGLKEGGTWEDNDFYFIDPSGGPFITVGSELDGQIVEKICSEFTEDGEDYIIYMK